MDNENGIVAPRPVVPQPDSQETQEAILRELRVIADNQVIILKHLELLK